MRLFLLPSLALTFLTALASQLHSDPQERTVDIFAWPLGVAKPQSLAQISYDQQNAIVKKYTAPLVPAEESIVRIGYHHASGAWSGIATAASNFLPDRTRKLRLHVTEGGQLYHVGFEAAKSGDLGAGAAGQDLQVEVVTVLKGASPVLNKPIVVSEDGQVEGKEPEKTFLQK
jgi:hypothetical protein